jgi:hypothetical protein
MDFDFSEEIRRLTDIQRTLMGNRDWNTAAESQYATAQHIADRLPPEIPDFTDHATLRQAGVIRELQPAVAGVMSCFQSGINGRHEDLLRACAYLERALFRCYEDEV